MRKIVDDVLKQQGKTAATGYPGGASSAICPGSNPSLTGTEGVVISTNAVGCAQPTEYAIYAALSPTGSGYTCIDSKSGRGSATTGGIPTNGTPGTCSGTSGGGGGGSLDLPDVVAYEYDSGPWGHSIYAYVTNSDLFTSCSGIISSDATGGSTIANLGYRNGINPNNLNEEVHAFEVNVPNAPGWDVTVQATCTDGTNSSVGFGSIGE